MNTLKLIRGMNIHGRSTSKTVAPHSVWADVPAHVTRRPATAVRPRPMQPSEPVFVFRAPLWQRQRHGVL